MKNVIILTSIILWCGNAFAGLDVFSGGAGGGGGPKGDGIYQIKVQTVLVADNGDDQKTRPFQLTPSSNYIEVTCNDPTGCDAVITTIGAKQGVKINIVNVSKNIINFPDSTGITDLAGNFSAGHNDSISMVFTSANEWIETSRSDN